MTRSHGLMAGIALQLGVLTAMYVGSVWPLWTGREIRLEIVPVDPRSMFRGNYARLSYAVSMIDANLFDGPERPLRKGEVVYVVVEEGEGGAWHATRIRLEPPSSGLFLRGRLTRSWSSDEPSLEIRYGIEAWFAPKEKALEIERVARRFSEGERAYAVLAVSDGGRAALSRLELP